MPRGPAPRPTMVDTDRTGGGRRAAIQGRSRGLRALWRRWRRGGAAAERKDEPPPLEADAPVDIVDQAEAFKTLRVDDVMTPRADIVAVELSCPFSELLAMFLETEHTRMPIYRETLD